MPSGNFIFVATYFILGKSEFGFIYQSYYHLFASFHSSVCYFLHGHVRRPQPVPPVQAVDSIANSLNTRKIVGGRGTDEHQPTASSRSRSNTNRHSNTFFLGTRVPSAWPADELNYDAEAAKVTLLFDSRRSNSAYLPCQLPPENVLQYQSFPLESTFTVVEYHYEPN
jgi:hypothetical protein